MQVRLSSVGGAPFLLVRVYRKEGCDMATIPTQCPACGSSTGWKKVDEGRKGFSVGKAAAGAVLLGPIGLVGGALGKKKETYYCTKCGFRNDY